MPRSFPQLCFCLVGLFPNLFQSAFGQTTALVSSDPSGFSGNGVSQSPSISSDGRWIAFSSRANNLTVSDANGVEDIFVRDREFRSLELVSLNSLGEQGNALSGSPSISASGRFVAFASEATNLVAGDVNQATDIFVRDRLLHRTEMVSLNLTGGQWDGFSLDPFISGNGRFVTFRTFYRDGNDIHREVFVHDRETKLTERVSVNSLGHPGNGISYSSGISGNGQLIAFQSDSNNLVPGDTNHASDIFVHDRVAKTTTRVSVASDGSQANGFSLSASISSDGKIVAFSSAADNLTSEQTNNFQIYTHDLQTGITELVSVDSTGIPGEYGGQNPSLSADGRYVGFLSQSTNLVPHDSNEAFDIFIHDRMSGIMERASLDSNGIQGNFSSSQGPALSGDGRTICFGSYSSNLDLQDLNGFYDVFVRDRLDGNGTNSVFLTGPSQAPVLSPIEFSWRATIGDSPYWLLYSQNKNGSRISGHDFDIGTQNHFSVLTSGTLSANGVGNFHSPPPDSFSAGYTVFFELAIRDSTGLFFDSNVHAVSFY